MVNPISEQQLALNRSLHESDPDFGNRDSAAGLASRLPLALLRMHENNMCSSVLDYGTGKGLLVKRLRRELPSLASHVRSLFLCGRVNDFIEIPIVEALFLF